MQKEKNKVYVAMSGGVDSSVAAAMLQEQGYDITGVYFKTYKPDGNKEYCKAQGADARKVCEKLGIPFKVYDLQEDYKKHVFNYMISEYKSARTPNPDIICNKEIKFGIFAKKAFDDGADYIATGHYARINCAKKCTLRKAVDEDKDQSYFLSQISKNILHKVIFPLGEYKKSETRKLAKKFSLHIAEKKDSQGLCFIGHEIHLKDFLKKYIDVQKGELLNVRGDVIGEHDGVVFYTFGERRGFDIAPAYKTTNMPRFFVISKDLKNNTLTVGNIEELRNANSGTKSVIIKNTNWFIDEPIKDKKYDCRIRHRGELYKCSFFENKITFDVTPYSPASGQFLAIYDEELCLGGGVIT